MSANILNGKAIAKQLRNKYAAIVDQHQSLGDRLPGLAVVLVGDDPASEVYVRHKRKACEEIGIHSFIKHFPSSVSQHVLLNYIKELNTDDSIDGILIQLPLPLHLDTNNVINAISPEKDVDGFHPCNMGLLAQQMPKLRPCTPMGVMHLLEATETKLAGKHAVVVGASRIVGRPMALELLMADCTVTICHRSTQNLAMHVKLAEILVVAIGNPDVIQAEWIPKDAIVIDVGVNRLSDGTLCGDIPFNDAEKRASWITPVPGGVGPMTVTMLLHNTLMARGWLPM